VRNPAGISSPRPARERMKVRVKKSDYSALFRARFKILSLIPIPHSSAVCPPKVGSSPSSITRKAQSSA
jgi:hypothetical protein